MTDMIPADTIQDVRQWTGLVRTGAWAAVASVAFIVFQIVAFIVWPPPAGVEEFYRLLHEHPLQGLLALDVLYPLSNVLTLLLYLVLAVALWRVSASAVVVALVFGGLGMASYLASPRPIEMLQLADLYARADPGRREMLVTVVEGMLATWRGTAFDAYYLLDFLALVIFAVLVTRSPVFGRATAVAALLAAILMAVPSNAGTVGLFFALVSLLPWSMFALLVARRLFNLLAQAGRVDRVTGSGPARAPRAGRPPRGQVR